MFTSLKKGATAVTAVLALAVTVGLAQVDTAVAGAKTKADILIESVGSKAKPGQPAPTRAMKTRRAAGRVCCSVRRKGVALLKPLQCRRLRGTVVPLNKCAQAGAKASDAYFVKVDRSTTTQNTKPARPGSSVRRRGSTAQADVTLKRGILNNQAAEIETSQSGDDESE